jgi:hypothetical protein
MVQWHNDSAKLYSMKSIVLAALCCVVLSLFLLGCEQPTAPSEVLSNPLDTLSSAFNKPVATITGGPSESQTITVSSVTFTWSGNIDAKEYSYNFDASGWLAWSSQTSVSLDYLDEGQHSFSVRARHRNGTTIEQNPPQVNFTVDAVKGPSLMFNPRRIVASRGQTFTYDIKAEEVSLIYGAKMLIQYDPSIVNVTSIIAGAMMTGNSGTAIILPTIDLTAHTITIEIATVGRIPKGVSGSGVIATLQCIARTSGNAIFQFDNSQTLFRDTLNMPITPNALVQGRVEIQ